MELEVKRLTSGRDDTFLAEENRLLRATSAASAMVIGGFHQDYDTVLVQSLQMLGESVQANYVGLWRNTEQDGSMHCYLKYRWTKNAHAIGAEKNKTIFRYDDLLPGWKKKLAEKHYVTCNESGPGGLAGGPSVQFLNAFDMKNAKSILLAPYYLHGGFWGMIGITRDNDVPFTSCEAETLLTGTYIIAFSLARHETFGRITMDREKAMADTLAKGEFLSRMSHEMRTPLNAIIGMTSIAHTEKDPEKIKEHLKKVEISSQLMLTVINDVLDMSKIEAGKLEMAKEPFNFNAMLNNAENIIKVKTDEKGQRFTVNYDQSMTSMVISDEHRLLQVIVNLLNNAMKFTPNMGAISLTAVQRKIGEAKARIRVEVRDSGIGLTMEQQKKLFSAFEQADGSITRKYGGTGLGLAICKKILNAMGGDIWVDSKPDQGACFFFELEADLGKPIHETGGETAAKTPVKASAIPHDWKKYAILLADDVDINREIIEITLGETGISIVSVENGKEAVEMLASDPGRFDLVLMDVQMPIMDGLSATKRIRAIDDPHAKKIPIVAMTANAFKGDIDICIAAGMNEHVAKPIAMDSFFAVLEKYLK
jgi:signal transduction histidine kinase/ActR/RegA family two-component response regulator